jgi:hypothetical protein
MQLQKTLLIGALLAASFNPDGAPAEERFALGPRQAGAHVSYHVTGRRTGVKDEQGFDTTLTLTSNDNGLLVASTSPALSEQVSLQPDGTIAPSDKTLRALVEPYNELQTALRDASAGATSSMRILVGDTEATVPVTVTIGPDGAGRSSVVVTGATDTQVHLARAHVVVNVRGELAGGRVVAASATNDATATVLFKKIHVQQVWSLRLL